MTDGPHWQQAHKALHAESACKQKATATAKGSQRVKPKYVLERCRIIDPNYNRAPFNRIHAPRAARNRRPAGWTDIWITLPKITVEGLQKVAITLAEDQQHSPWPKERRRYPRSRSHLVGEALDHYFRELGFPEFCLQPEEGELK